MCVRVCARGVYGGTRGHVRIFYFLYRYFSIVNLPLSSMNILFEILRKLTKVNNLFLLYSFVIRLYTRNTIL